MVWFKVDDSLYGHRKRAGVSLSAIGLWTLSGCWAANQLTDGFIPRSMLPLLGGRSRDVDELVDAHLWDVKGDGWQFHNWSDYQPTRVQIMADREAGRARMRRVRERRQGES